MEITNEWGQSEMSDISPLPSCFTINDPVIHLNAKKKSRKTHVRCSQSKYK